jgi:CTP-dependent riboflavin kinase
MTTPDWITLKGRLKQGYRVASGPSAAYPQYGSIEKQKPFFKALGLELDGMFDGTLNISIEPYAFEMAKPRHTFRGVRWTELTNAEDFSFSACRVRFKNREYEGWVYYPHPETKHDHFQERSTVEVLAPFIEGLRYGDALELLLDPQEVKVTGIT